MSNSHAELAKWVEANSTIQSYHVDAERNVNVGNCQFAVGATLYGTLLYERGVRLSAQESSNMFRMLLRENDQYPLWDKTAPRIPFASIPLALANDPLLEVRYSHENTPGGSVNRQLINNAINELSLLNAWGMAPHTNLLEDPSRYPNVNIDWRSKKKEGLSAIENYLRDKFKVVFLVKSKIFFDNAKQIEGLEDFGEDAIHALAGLALSEDSRHILVYDPDGGFYYQTDFNPSTGGPKKRVNWISIEKLSKSILIAKPITAVRNRL